MRDVIEIRIPLGEKNAPGTYRNVGQSRSFPFGFAGFDPPQRGRPSAARRLYRPAHRKGHGTSSCSTGRSDVRIGPPRHRSAVGRGEDPVDDHGKQRRGTGILVQAKAVVEVVSQSAGKEFSPGIVQCFRELAAEESFWLDFASPRIYSVLSGMVQWPRVELDLHAMEEIAKIFCRIVDFRSRFTSTHTAGVAAVARGLAQMMCFSGKGCQLRIPVNLTSDSVSN